MTWQQEDIEVYDSPDTKVIFFCEATGKIRILFEKTPLKYTLLRSDFSNQHHCQKKSNLFSVKHKNKISSETIW
jgi:hypothetical protein